GRHSTTSRSLFVLPSGAVVVDTPGLRGVALAPDLDEGLAEALVDVEELPAACRADCGRTTEPGCAVAASIAAGDLLPERVESWRRWQRELAWQERRRDARLLAEDKERWKGVHLAQRARGHRP
ncbi:MAG: ribosome small subunit-dependent GTPase A, partial [Actinomycetota bacterium]|nr:ribosome small subunit-dependent GTPase A [Actinomycetota bacterium]